jgi:hypothetical protein
MRTTAGIGRRSTADMRMAAVSARYLRRMDEGTRGSLESWAPWALVGVAVVIGLIAAMNQAWWTVVAMAGLAGLALASRAELRRRRRRHRTTRPGDD